MAMIDGSIYRLAEMNLYRNFALLNKTVLTIELATS